MSKDKRIDLTELEEEFKDGLNWDDMNTMELITELKKMYKREEELLDALRIIKEDLDSGIAQGNIPIKATNGIDLTKIRNFANDASL